MRSALTPDDVYPLFELVWAENEPDPYGETPKFPKRSAVRLICERSGELTFGIDVFYPVGGEDAIEKFLPESTGARQLIHSSPTSGTSES